LLSKAPPDGQKAAVHFLGCHAERNSQGKKLMKDLSEIVRPNDVVFASPSESDAGHVTGQGWAGQGMAGQGMAWHGMALWGGNFLFWKRQKDVKDMNLVDRLVDCHRPVGACLQCLVCARVWDRPIHPIKTIGVRVPGGAPRNAWKKQ
jgi:hypothetical protein